MPTLTWCVCVGVGGYGCVCVRVCVLYGGGLKVVSNMCSTSLYGLLVANWN